MAGGLALSALGLGIGMSSAQATDTINVYAFGPDVGGVMKLYAVPAQVSLPNAEHSNTIVTIDPDDVPAVAFQSGIASFQAQRFAATGAASWSFSLQRDPANADLWISPLADPQASGGADGGPQGSQSTEIDLTLHSYDQLDADPTPPPPDPADGGEIDPDPSSADAYQPGPHLWDVDPGLEPETPPGTPTGEYAAQCTLLQTAIPAVTVGTSYPVDSNLSNLEYSSAMSTETGTAVTFRGHWVKSGSRATKDSWGQDFAKSKYNRSYRIAVKYGHYVCQNVITGYTWHQASAMFQTGGTNVNNLSVADRPAWGNCQNIAVGRWYRGSVRGNDYQLSYGVKSASLVGFEMYSKHAYSSGTVLNYWVTGSKKMCGSDDVPAKAGKLIERYR